MSKDEFMDEELVGMVSYSDETVPAEMPVMKTSHNAKARCAESEGKAAPLFSRKRTVMDRLFGCVKWLIPCGGISMLLWWFQINGLMDMIAAYPCILACGIVGAFGTGMNVVK